LIAFFFVLIYKSTVECQGDKTPKNKTKSGHGRPLERVSADPGIFPNGNGGVARMLRQLLPTADALK